MSLISVSYIGCWKQNDWKKEVVKFLTFAIESLWCEKRRKGEGVSERVWWDASIFMSSEESDSAYERWNPSLYSKLLIWELLASTYSVRLATTISQLGFAKTYKEEECIKQQIIPVPFISQIQITKMLMHSLHQPMTL